MVAVQLNHLPVWDYVAVWRCRHAVSLSEMHGHHETMRLHTNNQKTARYSTKSATRTFCEYGANLRMVLCDPNASRFSWPMYTKLCIDVEGDYWSMLM